VKEPNVPGTRQLATIARQRKAKAPPGVEWVDMKVVTELADGGKVEATDTAIVPMGEVFAYRQLTYTHAGDANLPACKIVFEVRNEVPVCTSVHLWSNTDSETAVRAKDLSALKLDNLRYDLYAWTGVFVENPDGGWTRKLVSDRRSFLQDRKSVERATPRRKLTIDFLTRVAELHNATSAGGRIEAVCDAFDVSERTAFRYIAQAKKRGLIESQPQV
jgi:hypothetical protein